MISKLLTRFVYTFSIFHRIYTIYFTVWYSRNRARMYVTPSSQDNAMIDCSESTQLAPIITHVSESGYNSGSCTKRTDSVPYCSGIFFIGSIGRIE